MVRASQHLRLCLLVISFFSVWSFSHAKDETLDADTARRHVMMVNERGQHLDPAAEWGLIKEQKNWGYPENVAAIEDGIAGFYNQSISNKTGRAEVVVFVHGGLNSYKSSKRRLKEMLSERNQMLTNGYYPLLIVWNSGIVSSYLEHLLDVRQGEIWPRMGKVTAPVMLAVDFGRGIVRLPLTLGGRWYNDWKTAELPNSRRGDSAAWEDLEGRLVDWQERAYSSDEEPKLIRAPRRECNARGWGERMFRLTSYVITQPFKIAILPVADGLATEAWDNMIRRTRTMFQPPTVYDFPAEYRKAFRNGTNSTDLQAKVDAWMGTSQTVPRKKSKSIFQSNPTPDGSMLSFAKQIESWSAGDLPKEISWQFVGHSMGTMVLNELFRVAPDIRAERITYMAAACSIRDFQENMVPYLRRQRLDKSCSIPFYNLCLHRIRERDNSMDIVDIIPRGTLLNYIDNIFAKPATITDRTLGSWENVIRALPDVPEDIRPQMHNVCFDLLPWSFATSNTNQPQNHPSFTKDFAFWKEEFVHGPKEKLEESTKVAAEGIKPPPPADNYRQSPPLKK